MINFSLCPGGHLSSCQRHWLCVLALPALYHTPITLHSPVSQCSGGTHLQMSKPITNLQGVVRKTHHSHMQGPKLIKSTDSMRRKVYPSHFLLSGNGTHCLVVIASLCHAESSHVLMNAAICMHKQLLRVYQTKLLYLE